LALLEVIGKNPGVGARERFEANNVEWLKRMGRVGRKHSQ
jgi:hypothetical protein